VTVGSARGRGGVGQGVAGGLIGPIGQPQDPRINVSRWQPDTCGGGAFGRLAGAQSLGEVKSPHFRLRQGPLAALLEGSAAVFSLLIPLNPLAPDQERICAPALPPVNFGLAFPAPVGFPIRIGRY
jgi:hypothetical protein